MNIKSHTKHEYKNEQKDTYSTSISTFHTNAQNGGELFTQSCIISSMSSSLSQCFKSNLVNADFWSSTSTESRLLGLKSESDGVMVC